MPDLSKSSQLLLLPISLKQPRQLAFGELCTLVASGRANKNDELREFGADDKNACKGCDVAGQVRLVEDFGILTSARI